MEPTVSRPTPLPSLWLVPAATGVQIGPCAFPIREAPAHRIYAAAGYVVLCVNFHGSTGCKTERGFLDRVARAVPLTCKAFAMIPDGLQYREAISKDWSGAAYDDIIAATEQASTLPYVDRARVRRRRFRVSVGLGSG